MGEARRQALRIGSLLFCPACGTLLDLPKDEQDEIECHSCGRREPASCESRLTWNLTGTCWQSAYENLPTTTYSSPQAFPSSLRSKRALVQNTTTEEQAAKSKDTIVSRIVSVPTSLMRQSDESCPKCSKQGLSYYTMQLRSADEGSTVFYEVSCLSLLVARANESVSNVATNTLKTINRLHQCCHIYQMYHTYFI